MAWHECESHVPIEPSQDLPTLFSCIKLPQRFRRSCLINTHWHRPRRRGSPRQPMAECREMFLIIRPGRLDRFSPLPRSRTPAQVTSSFRRACATAASVRRTQTGQKEKRGQRIRVLIPLTPSHGGPRHGRERETRGGQQNGRKRARSSMEILKMLFSYALRHAHH